MSIADKIKELEIWREATKRYWYEPSLPLPLVDYPHDTGIFPVFRHQARSTPVLCSCFRPAVENLFRWRIARHKSRMAWLATRMGQKKYQALGAWEKRSYTAPLDLLDERYFPSVFARYLDGLGVTRSQEDLAAYIPYVDNVCHLCQRAAPSVGWQYFGHKYSPFQQEYGRYILIQALTCGFMAWSLHHDLDA